VTATLNNKLKEKLLPSVVSVHELLEDMLEKHKERRYNTQHTLIICWWIGSDTGPVWENYNIRSH
jgi:hypothetical protein